MKDERVLKFLQLFLKDQTYETLCTAMEKKDCEEAFRAAHTMKGLCQNMAFDWLLEPVSALTECLRGGSWSEEAEKQFTLLTERYLITRKEIEKL